MGYTKHSKTSIAETDVCADPMLCRLLGFFLPAFGLLIAAIISKAPGVKQALIGMAWRYLACVGVALLWCCLI
ncbi:MAG: hypothetical protein IKP97_05260 [Kiritimatiellae bacterium]|nr:hypothetical protein [Kiritimatiellia bacterium]